MAFPEIESCLICEDVRPEQNNKLSILGFFGISPTAQILVGDITKPIQQLTFMLITGKGEGTFRVSFELKDEKGKALLTTPESEFKLPTPAQRNNWMIGLHLPAFQEEGFYYFVLRVDGKESYKAKFEVKQGTPDDLKK